MTDTPLDPDELKLAAGSTTTEAVERLTEFTLPHLRKRRAGSAAARLDAKAIEALLSERASLAERLEEAEKALEKAAQFITNGVELGFIRMPDADTPDPAHETLPAIRKALTTIKEPSHEA